MPAVLAVGIFLVVLAAALVCHHLDRKDPS